MVSLHYTRHNYASMALRAGESLAAVSEVLGGAMPIGRTARCGCTRRWDTDAASRGYSDTVAGLLNITFKGSCDISV